MGKRILAIIVGVIAGVVVIFAVQSISHIIYALPEGIDQKNAEAMKNAISNMPAGAFLFVLLSYALGAFAAGLTSALIFPQGKYLDSVIAGGVLLVFGLINLITLPHPFWFWIVSLMLYLPCALLGAKVRR